MTSSQRKDWIHAQKKAVLHLNQKGSIQKLIPEAAIKQLTDCCHWGEDCHSGDRETLGPLLHHYHKLLRHLTLRGTQAPHRDIRHSSVSSLQRTFRQTYPPFLWHEATGCDAHHTPHMTTQSSRRTLQGSCLILTTYNPEPVSLMGCERVEEEKEPPPTNTSTMPHLQPSQESCNSFPQIWH